MKIRQKLTLSFTLTVILVLSVFAVAIYYFASQYRKGEYFNALDQRVEITEKMFLEKENLPPETYALIREQFLNKLPAETEEVINIKDGLENLIYPSLFLNRLQSNDHAYFENDSVQGVGKIFHLAGGNYAVIITAKDPSGKRMLAYLRTIIMVALACSISMVALVSFYISTAVLNPITQKIKKANAISARNLHERLTVKNPDDEIGALAVAFNNLLDRLTSAFDAQRAFVDNASHEMRNPLAAIIGEAELALERDRNKEAYVESFQSIAAEANRLNLLVNNLLHLANIGYREVSVNRELIDPKELIMETKNKFDFIRPENKIDIQFGSGINNRFILGSDHLLQTALINIFDNACKFSANKTVAVKVEGNQAELVISISDSGLGIPPEDIPKVTQPFHRANNVRHIEGSGIGIPLTAKIMELHFGKIEITSTLSQGTTVVISLPIVK